MPKCTYCGKDYEAPRGVTVVESISGRTKYFCSSKCRKYSELGKKKGKWAGGKPGKRSTKKRKSKKKKR
jgi:ribosomal protein L24E